jgi:hypothetical protein
MQLKAGSDGWRSALRRHSYLVIWFTGFALYGVDFLVKKMPVWREPIDVWVPIDDAFPLIAGWAWVYIFAWIGLMFCMAGWYAWEQRDHWPRVRALIIGVVLMQVSGWIFLFAVPTYFGRPELAPELLGGSLIAQIYATDAPVHKLPSLHMGSIFLVSWFFCWNRRLWRYALGVGAVALITLSVLFTKQHGVVDVVVGIAWGWMACHVGVHLSHRIERRKGAQLQRVINTALRRSERPTAASQRVASSLGAERHEPEC